MTTLMYGYDNPGSIWAPIKDVFVSNWAFFLFGRVTMRPCFVSIGIISLVYLLLSPIHPEIPSCFCWYGWVVSCLCCCVWFVSDVGWLCMNWDCGKSVHELACTICVVIWLLALPSKIAARKKHFLWMLVSTCVAHVGNAHKYIKTCTIFPKG